jgi:hypothetical protein
MRDGLTLNKMRNATYTSKCLLPEYGNENYR